jgi:hypothetical protein
MRSWEVAMTTTERRFSVGICRLYPGVKLPHRDPRWGEHTHGFNAETHTLETFAEAMAVHGYAFSAVMREGYRKNENFVSSSVLALDFDTEDPRSALETLASNSFIQGHAAFLCETPSSLPGRPRSRVVFVLDQPITDAGQYVEAAKALIWRYGGTADDTGDAARFFYGRPNAPRKVLGNVLFNDILQVEVVEPYLKAMALRFRASAIAEPVGEVIPEHHRNKTLASYAGRLRRDGLNQMEIEAALLAINTARCKPPLDDAEVIDITRSISRYPPCATTPSELRLPTITIGGFTRDLTKVALETMAEPPEELLLVFQRGGGLVRLVEREGEAVVEALTPDSLHGHLERVADWMRETEWEIYPASPPMRVVKDLLSLPRYPKSIPALRGLIHAPVALPDGRILTARWADEGMPRGTATLGSFEE